VRVVNLAYRVEDFFIDGTRTDEVDITARISSEGACFIVIDSPDRESLLAAVWVEVHDGRGHFALLSVDPAQQGKGLGRILVDAVEKHCLSAGCRHLDLEVVDLRLELPAFYSRLGFVTAGTAPFPDTSKLRRDAHLILMTKQLAATEASGLSPRHAAHQDMAPSP
jgi:ribosomal protein S18 acetylase RimI-like enzyme